MGVAELIYQHSLHLSEEEAKQALAFVQFLEQRSLLTRQDDSVVRQLGTLKAKVSVEFKDDWNISDEELLNS